MHSVAPEEDQASIQVDSEKHKQAEGHRGPAPIPEQLEAALGEAAREGKAKNFEKALIAATRAHFVEPNNPTAMFLTAQAQYGLEDFADALQSFCRCKELLKLDCCSDQTASTASKCDQGIAICTRKISSSRAPADENESTTASLAAPPAFPRTPHLAFSPGVGGDDIVRGSEGVVLNGREVVITEKLDGGNCCFFQGKVYARTHAHETSLPWFSAAKQIAATVAAEGTLPPHTALFLENMEAVHSIDYGHLPSPVFVIAALRLDAPTPTLYAWDDLCALARSLGLPTPPGLGPAPACARCIPVCVELTGRVRCAVSVSVFLSVPVSMPVSVTVSLSPLCVALHSLSLWCVCLCRQCCTGGAGCRRCGWRSGRSSNSSPLPSSPPALPPLKASSSGRPERSSWERGARGAASMCAKATCRPQPTFTASGRKPRSISRSDHMP